MGVLVNVDHQSACLNRVVLSDDTQTCAWSVQQYTVESAWEYFAEFASVSACNSCVSHSKTV